jgi:hypothetical protein
MSLTMKINGGHHLIHCFSGSYRPKWNRTFSSSNQFIGFLALKGLIGGQVRRVSRLIKPPDLLVHSFLDLSRQVHDRDFSQDFRLPSLI